MIDIKYKPNQLILALTFIVSVLGWLMTGGFLPGLSIGVSVFLAWALAREVDPKHDYSALMVAGFSLFNLFYYESIQLLIIFWLLLLLRMINGLCGKTVTAFDMFLTLGFTIYLSFNNENSIYLVIFLLVLYLVSKSRKLTLTLVIINVVGFILFLVQSFILDYLKFNSISEFDTATILILSLLVLSFVMFWFLPKGEVKDDEGNSVPRAKILTGQILYSTTVLLLTLFDDLSLNNLIIYGSVILGVSLYFAGSKLIKQT